MANTIIVLRAFGAPLILNPIEIIATPVPVVWYTRDQFVAWYTRDQFVAWEARA